MGEHTKDLYHKYLKGSLSKTELAEYRKEMACLSDDELWAMMNESVDDNPAEHMSDFIKDLQLAEISEEINRQRKRRIMAYVASLLFLLLPLAGTYLFFVKNKNTSANMTQVVVAQGNKTTVMLPDGSKVSLNGNTIFEYDVEAGSHRNVKIVKGEAFFDVAKDPSCPFNVIVEDMNIQVLGTTFNVKARRGKIETALFTGAVKLALQDMDSTYQLKPGQKSIYNQGQRRLQMTESDMSLDAGWKDGYLTFHSAPLSEVLEKIEDWYAVKITLSDQQLRNDLMTGSFHGETLESVLRSLSIQYGFKYEYRGDEILIKQ